MAHALIARFRSNTVHPMATLQLEQLFRACDSRGSGYLDRGELRRLCHQFSISSHDADAIFEDLDHDNDGKINFTDFEKGFKDFLTQLPGSPPEVSECSQPSTPEALPIKDGGATLYRCGQSIDKTADAVPKGDDDDAARVWNIQRAWQNLTTEMAKAGNMIK